MGRLGVVRNLRISELVDHRDCVRHQHQRVAVLRRLGPLLPHSSLMPADRTSSDHLFDSALLLAANASGVLLVGSKLAVFSWLRTSALFTAFTTLLWMT